MPAVYENSARALEFGGYLQGHTGLGGLWAHDEGDAPAQGAEGLEHVVHESIGRLLDAHILGVEGERLRRMNFLRFLDNGRANI